MAYYTLPYLFELYPIQPPKQFVNACSIIIVNDNSRRRSRNKKNTSKIPPIIFLNKFNFIESKKKEEKGLLCVFVLADEVIML